MYSACRKMGGGAVYEEIIYDWRPDGCRQDYRVRDSEEKANCAIAAIALLDEYRIPFSCSMVGMPNITGTDDMRQTIRDIAHYGADSIQIFMPGFSSHIKKNILTHFLL